MFTQSKSFKSSLDNILSRFQHIWLWEIEFWAAALLQIFRIGRDQQNYKNREHIFTPYLKFFTQRSKKSSKYCSTSTSPRNKITEWMFVFLEYSRVKVSHFRSYDFRPPTFDSTSCAKVRLDWWKQSEISGSSILIPFRVGVGELSLNKIGTLAYCISSWNVTAGLCK